jgi:hypothetical protein
VNVINLLALLFSPVVAVLITRWLDNRNNKYKERIEIFKTLMATRYMVTSHEKVRALNSIDVIFADVPKVREAWKDLLREYNEPIPKTAAEDKMLYLLETMAISIGYKEKIKWDTIKSYYIPRGLAEEMRENDELRKYQLEAMKATKTKQEIEIL